MEHLLLIEEDQALGRGITLALAAGDREPHLARTLAEGRRLFAQLPISLVILDLNLPDGNGLELLTEIRSVSQVPVLILTANDLESDQVTGLELGADDYVTKPFSMRILLKKVYVILSRKSQEANIYDDGFLKVDFELGIVQQGVNECLLSPTEYRILKKLIENKGKLLTYSVLLDSLWDEGVQITDKHTLAVNINRLRKKIETEEHSYISNVYGMGYIWK